ncbi:MAG TPA: isochorismate synthase, partial [Streptomyces sp.]|nr:isochorismate synthase [Streptomyces sp.]
MSASPSVPADSPPVGSPGAATALLEAYRPGSDRFLATPRHTFLGSGSAAEVPHDDRPVALRVREVLEARRRAGDPAPVVIGALPFAPDGVPALAVP